MGAGNITRGLMEAALDRVLARALATADVSKTVRTDVEAKLLEKYEDLFWDDLQGVIDRTDSPGGLLERWLERHRDELMGRIADLAVTRLFSDPGGPSLFLEEVLDSVAMKLIEGDGTESAN